MEAQLTLGVGQRGEAIAVIFRGEIEIVGGSGVGLWNLCMDPPTPVDAATMRIPVGFGDYTYYIAIRCYES